MKKLLPPVILLFTFCTVSAKTLYMFKTENRPVIDGTYNPYFLVKSTQYSDKISGEVFYRVGVRSNYPCRPIHPVLYKAMCFGGEISEDIVVSNVETISKKII